jgi:hypothetical protein
MTPRRALGWIAGGAFALRALLMMARGDYIVYDEGYYLLLERSLRALHGFALNGLPHVALSPLQPVLVAVLATAGIPDVWASRLLAVLCGALLVFPVAALARRAGGPRAAVVAAGLTAASPALMSFVPFFPGESWNLYFGSEPLFLLLAFGAVAAAMRADEGRWGWWVATGALAAGAYLTRAEGLVLGPVLFAALAARLLARRAGPAAWRRFGVACVSAAVIASPYLLYLHGTLGRWAVSGRVQAVGGGGGGAATAVANARSGGQVLDEFVWQGQPDAFWRALNGLDASGRRMASQYWGVQRAAAVPVPAPVDTGAVPSGGETGRATPGAASAPERRGPLAVWRAGLAAVVPWWRGLLAMAGVVLATRESLVWAFPLAVCAILPSALTYVEPRSLLPLAPLAAAFASVVVLRIAEGVPLGWRPRAVWFLPALAALALLAPALRELAQAWPQRTPLQQVATARRAVGEYLEEHLPAGAAVMSWHPAVAIWAHRPWRVLPYDTFQRIATYAEAEHAAAVVFSKFTPSPIRQPPRPFTVVLPSPGDSTAAGGGGSVQLEPVDETPLLFVGRLRRAARSGAAP